MDKNGKRAGADEDEEALGTQEICIAPSSCAFDPLDFELFEEGRPDWEVEARRLRWPKEASLEVRRELLAVEVVCA